MMSRMRELEARCEMLEEQGRPQPLLRSQTAPPTAAMTAAAAAPIVAAPNPPAPSPQPPPAPAHASYATPEQVRHRQALMQIEAALAREKDSSAQREDKLLSMVRSLREELARVLHDRDRRVAALRADRATIEGEKREMEEVAARARAERVGIGRDLSQMRREMAEALAAARQQTKDALQEASDATRRAVRAEEMEAAAKLALSSLRGEGERMGGELEKARRTLRRQEDQAAEREGRLEKRVEEVEEKWCQEVQLLVHSLVADVAWLAGAVGSVETLSAGTPDGPGTAGTPKPLSVASPSGRAAVASAVASPGRARVAWEMDVSGGASASSPSASAPALGLGPLPGGSFPGVRSQVRDQLASVKRSIEAAAAREGAMKVELDDCYGRLERAEEGWKEVQALLEEVRREQGASRSTEVHHKAYGEKLLMVLLLMVRAAVPLRRRARQLSGDKAVLRALLRRQEGQVMEMAEALTMLRAHCTGEEYAPLTWRKSAEVRGLSAVGCFRAAGRAVVAAGRLRALGRARPGALGLGRSVRWESESLPLLAAEGPWSGDFTMQQRALNAYELMSASWGRRGRGGGDGGGGALGPPSVTDAQLQLEAEASAVAEMLAGDLQHPVGSAVHLPALPSAHAAPTARASFHGSILQVASRLVELRGRADSWHRRAETAATRQAEAESACTSLRVQLEESRRLALAAGAASAAAAAAPLPSYRAAPLHAPPPRPLASPPTLPVLPSERDGVTPLVSPALADQVRAVLNASDTSAFSEDDDFPLGLPGHRRMLPGGGGFAYGREADPLPRPTHGPDGGEVPWGGLTPPTSHSAPSLAPSSGASGAGPSVTSADPEPPLGVMKKGGGKDKGKEEKRKDSKAAAAQGPDQKRKAGVGARSSSGSSTAAGGGGARVKSGDVFPGTRPSTLTARRASTSALRGGTASSGSSLEGGQAGLGTTGRARLTSASTSKLLSGKSPKAATGATAKTSRTTSAARR